MPPSAPSTTIPVVDLDGDIEVSSPPPSLRTQAVTTQAATSPPASTALTVEPPSTAPEASIPAVVAVGESSSNPPLV